jgi:predicted Zn-dependent protease
MKTSNRKNARRASSWAMMLALSTLLAPAARAGLFSVSPAKERSVGADAAREIESHAPLVTGPVEDWVEAVGKRLALASNKEFEYSFRVIDDPTINAFALPGGYIYVNSGLRKIVRTDDELAAILAHEITHAEEHHFARQYSKASKRSAILGIGAMVLGASPLAANALDIANYAIMQKYSRGQEEESDLMGMRRLSRAGFDPAAMVTILDRLAKEDDSQGTLDKWFASHPEGEKRAAAARTELQSIRALQAKNDALVKPIFPKWNGAQAESPASTVPGTSGAPASATPGR